MAVATLREIDEQHEREASIATEESEKQVRITLAKDAARPLKLSWMAGKGSRPSSYVIQPGKSIVQPLGKAQAWFGPFAAFEEYAVCTDEKRKEKLREFIYTETRRYLNTYDYPRKSHKEMEPCGPHRSPDVTVTILDADGNEHESIRLFQIYEIGPWDPLADQFGRVESAEEVKARYESALNAQAAEHAEKMAALELKMERVTGMVQGIVAGKKVAPKGDE